MWQYKSTSNSSTGSKLSYLCKCDNKCSGRIQIWVPNDTLDVFVRTNDEHDHAPRSLQGISPNSKKILTTYGTTVKENRKKSCFRLERTVTNVQKLVFIIYIG